MASAGLRDGRKQNQTYIYPKSILQMETGVEPITVLASAGQCDYATPVAIFTAPNGNGEMWWLTSDLCPYAVARRTAHWELGRTLSVVAGPSATAFCNQIGVGR